MSDRKEGTLLWWVRRIDGTDAHFFLGDLSDLVTYINELHVLSGVHYCARQLES
jgi:hypothetical protein